MNALRIPGLLGALLLGLAVLAHPYDGWQHTGSLYLLTTPDGAHLPATASVTNFPVLVRLQAEWFDFSQLQSHGEDLRFSSSSGEPLAYQIEAWDPAQGSASVWVRVPVIRGLEQQELHLHWGQPKVASESNGSAVFNASNGYLSVWHMTAPVKDEVGTLVSKDIHTTSANGQIGPARHLAGQQGIFGGDQITGYPVGAEPHSSELWFRAEQPNGRALAWGNEHGQGKVVTHFQSPPHVKMECYFSGADVSSQGRMPMNEWIHVVHTYQPGDSRIYVNGALSGVSSRKEAPLAIKSPARLFIGGWYDHYDFVGDIDEVRISKVARSPDWIRLQHENQKTHQTLVGPLVSPGQTFKVSRQSATIAEGQSLTFSAQAGGARKLYWSLKQNGQETPLAVDRLSLTYAAGRVTGNQSATLVCKAVYPTETKTQEIALQIQERIPDPRFTLKAPRQWDGRTPLTLEPDLHNQQAIQTEGAEPLKVEWSVSPLAVIQEVTEGKLHLLRAQHSGNLTLTAALSNGGQVVTQSVVLAVQEPAHDPWLERTPAPEEKPEDGQFFARNDQNEGTLHYRGVLPEPADSVFLRVSADGKPYQTLTAQTASQPAYGFAVKLKPGLIKYQVQFGTRSGGTETVRNTVTNLVCGDAYLIDGQSNALATDTGEKSSPETHDWVRSYGGPPDDSAANPGNLWCNPVWKAEHGEKAELGWWGMELAKRLVASQQMPICIINAAAGGTRIDQHQRHPRNPTDVQTLYGRMLWRVQHARLTHGIRGILWHQGESDQGADGPSGGYGWETYQSLFVAMAGAWKQDFPNVQHYYVFQIWPDSCSMGGRNGAGDRLREQQRTLPQRFSHLSLMSTLGIRPPGGCHFPLVGWAEFARLIQPLIERDLYGKLPTTSITPPNLRRAAYVGADHDTVALEFDQPVVWTPALASEFYLDGAKGLVASGSVSGNVLTLQLKTPGKAKQITYLKEVAWNQDRLLLGANGLAALTFCEVSLDDPQP